MSKLSERSVRAVWHPCSQMKQHETLPPLPVARAEGVWLYDPDGKRYLDAISSCGSTSSATATRTSPHRCTPSSTRWPT
jgi:adenosylmethionine-8-amino-7-oxononanoate aminotransferase